MQFTGRYIPKWVMVVLLLAAGAGATVGPVLASYLVGKTVVTATQGVLFTAISNTSAGLPATTVFFQRIGEKRTDFTVAFDKLPTNSLFSFEVTLQNNANKDQAMVLTLTVPEGLEMDLVFNGFGPGDVQYGRVGPTTWELKVPQGTSTLEFEGALRQGTPPGLYEIQAKIEPLPEGTWS